MFKTLMYEKKINFATVILNRPEAHNAINFQVMQELNLVLDDVKSDSNLGALILTGSGEKSFCSGGDIKEFRTLKTIDDARRMSGQMQEVLFKIENLEIPVITAINGDAYGGGCEIIVACDIRIISEEARLGFRQIKYGTITGWGGANRLQRIIGKSDALRILVTGQTLSALEAINVGLVDEVAPRKEVVSRAKSLAGQIAKNPIDCIRSYKKAITYGIDSPLDAAIDFETELFCQQWTSEIREQAFEAFAKIKGKK